MDSLASVGDLVLNRTNQAKYHHARKERSAS